ncbi:MAG: DUF1501 domain-containing protein [Bacteroidota bacterium]|nr:DUF1501 domain-containing protein [Bacteroidota bacterium]
MSAVNNRSGRFGSCLAHGCAHTEDHERWSRRDFLAGLGLVAGSALMLGKTPVHAFSHTSLLNELGSLSSERILVLVQLEGGNDGLNTIVPIENDHYYRARPRLAIPKVSTLQLTSELGFHPSMRRLRDTFDNGQMAIIQGVGYQDSSLSHFRGTDIWMTASDRGSHRVSGWTGRQLEVTYPGIDTDPPSFPLAVQIGGLTSSLLTGEHHSVGMSLTNTEVFERLIRNGRYYNEGNVPSSSYGREMAFVRRVANDAYRYGIAVKDAADRGVNEVEYLNPGGNGLARRLRIVARLIKGSLGARVYHVGLAGFDTHGSQGSTSGRHSLLLKYLSEAVTSFLADLGSLSEQVLVMTFSEFGRRVEQNGSEGTDHGTAAPLFLFGPGVRGGLYGQAPSLSDLDPYGNMRHHVDFRAIYATVLQHWFGFAPRASEEVLGQAFEPVEFVQDPADPIVTSSQQPALPDQPVLHQNYPNPFRSQTTVSFTLHRPVETLLQVYDLTGRQVRSLPLGIRPAGTHAVTVEVANLSSGTYLYRLIADRQAFSRKMSVIR